MPGKPRWGRGVTHLETIEVCAPGRTEPFGAGLLWFLLLVGIQVLIFPATSERMNSGHHIVLYQSANPNSHY